MKNKKRQLGFTLVEMVTVVSIIIILVAVAVANFRGAEERANLELGVEDVAGVIREAKSYSLAQKPVEEIEGMQGPLGPQAEDPGVPVGGYGVYFNTAQSLDSFVFFADIDGNGSYEIETDYRMEIPLTVGLVFNEFINLDDIQKTELSILFRAPEGTARFGNVQVSAEPYELAEFEIMLEDSNMPFAESSLFLQVSAPVGLVDIVQGAETPAPSGTPTYPGADEICADPSSVKSICEEPGSIEDYCQSSAANKYLCQSPEIMKEACEDPGSLKTVCTLPTSMDALCKNRVALKTICQNPDQLLLPCDIPASAGDLCKDPVQVKKMCENPSLLDELCKELPQYLPTK